ncbi:MAG: caspase family protein [Bacteroidales bacterium]|nr:caspase family protein [Bacteroidales bacterium]
MKITRKSHRGLMLMAMLAVVALAPLGTDAQEPVSAAQTEHQYNDDIHSFILKRLRQTTLQREKKMNKQIQQMLVNLPNAEKLYDETFVRITTQVVEDTTEEGSPEINFVYNISYNCHHFEGTEDDYPSGAYLWSTSNSCRAICNLTKSMIESELSDIFTAGRNTTITITSTTDAAEIQHIDYKGEFGDLRYMPAVFNDENVRISVDQKDGITTNAQLAYLRARSVQSFLDEQIGVLKRSQNEYRFVTRCFDMTGPHYRRSSLQIVVHGAFDAAARSLEAALLNDEYVDFNIPHIEENINSKTYALIIADEEYTAPLPNCDFATNDGDVLHQYFVHTLGIPTRHVKVLHNAGRQEIYNEGIHWLKDIIKAQSGDVHIIIYYAGHGVSNQKWVPYLMPSGVDVSKIRAFRSKTGTLPEDIVLKGGDAEKILSQCISFDTLTGWFNRVEALSYTFIIDASFDGIQRSGKPFFTIKKESKRYRTPRVRSDIVVFMAADGDKTAYSFIDQHHGFFTYYILKELKYTRGEITFQDLFNNVTKNQAYESSLQGKLQEPSMIIGGKLGENWGTRTFINN